MKKSKNSVSLPFSSTLNFSTIDSLMTKTDTNGRGGSTQKIRAGPDDGNTFFFFFFFFFHFLEICKDSRRGGGLYVLKLWKKIK